MTYTEPIRPDELYHHGIKGQRWGIRRFQNEDGSYTAAGRKRYGYGSITGMDREYHSKATKKYESRYGKNSAQAKASRELDRKITEKRRDEAEFETGKSFVKNLLIGSSMNKTYTMARAAGMDRGEAIARSILDINGGTVVAGLVATAVAAPVGVAIGGAGAAAGATAAVTGAGKTAGYIIGKATQDVVTRKNYGSGSEWSLQQQAIRKRYVNTKTRRKR